MTRWTRLVKGFAASAPLTPLFALTGLLALAVAPAPAQAADPIDFDKQIRPILAKTCYECHGPEKQKGDLRLDTKEGFLATDYVLVSKKADESELFVRITLPADHDDIMPPKGDTLTKEQQELIKSWIESGGDFGAWIVDADAASGAKKIVLPTVDPADPKAVEALVKLGALAMPLAKDTNLLNVDFRAVADTIGDSHMELLKPVAKQVAWLNLGRTKISDEGIKELKELTNVMRLHLENTAVTDTALMHLRPMQSLQYLNLYGTKVTDKGLRYLGRMKELEKVYLWQTAVTEEAAAELGKSNPDLEVNLGWKAPPPAPEEKKEEVAAADTKADAKAEAKAINAKCPVSGKDIDAAQTFAYKGNVIAFCCEMCKGKFEANPEKFVAKVEGFKPVEEAKKAEAKPADAPKAEPKKAAKKGKGKKKKD